MYSDNINNNYDDVIINNNMINVEDNFNKENSDDYNRKDVSVNNNVTIKIRNPIIRNSENIRNCCVNKERELINYTPADVVKEYFDCLPRNIKTDLCDGPVSRCENVPCKKPVFNYATYEFCLGLVFTYNIIISSE